MEIAIALRKRGVMLVSAQDEAVARAYRWYVDTNGYVRVEVGGRTTRRRLYFHRHILDAPRGVSVDHINGDPLDNRRENLRLANQSQQNANKPKRHGATSFKGVYLRHDGRAWCAQIKAHGVARYLGSFTDPAEAALAYDNAARIAFGKYACLNFPRADERSALKPANT